MCSRGKWEGIKEAFFPGQPSRTRRQSAALKGLWEETLLFKLLLTHFLPVTKVQTDWSELHSLFQTVGALGLQGGLLYTHSGLFSFMWKAVFLQVRICTRRAFQQVASYFPS